MSYTFKSYLNGDPLATVDSETVNSHMDHDHFFVDDLGDRVSYWSEAYDTVYSMCGTALVSMSED